MPQAPADTSNSGRTQRNQTHTQSNRFDNASFSCHACLGFQLDTFERDEESSTLSGCRLALHDAADGLKRLLSSQAFSHVDNFLHTLFKDR